MITGANTEFVWPSWQAFLCQHVHAEPIKVESAAGALHRGRVLRIARQGDMAEDRACATALSSFFEAKRNSQMAKARN